VSLFEVEVPTERVPPDLLDRRLAEGWLRSGPVLFRSEMLCIDEDVRGVVQIRLPLDREVRSRSQRRVLRRNRKRFRNEVGPARVDAERERLYEATKPRFVGPVSRELSPLILSGDVEVFDTREFCVYDGDRLVAVSYFDVGRESVVTQLALHDPEYARFGLGFYTMLEEIELARSAGARFFYPGYVIPGMPSFEYKLRIGDVQYLEGNGRWRRRAQPPTRVRSAERVVRRVRALQRALEREDVAHERWIYPAFWISYLDGVGGLDADYLQALLHVRCASVDAQGRFLVVEYLAEHDEFQLSLVRPEHELELAAEYDAMESLPVFYERRALAYEDGIFRAASAKAVARETRSALEKIDTLG